MVLRKSSIFCLLFIISTLNLSAKEFQHIFTSSKPHEIAIISQGSAALQIRLDMIARAKESIDIEYFIYADDISGRIFNQALVAKAQEGVKVRILLDYLSTKKTFGRHYATVMREHNIEVKYFNTKKILRIKKVQYRNHRKLIVIDKKEALTGSSNIADDYFDLGHKFNFLDRDIHIVGPIVKNMLETYEEFWQNKNSKRLKRTKKKKKLRIARKFLVETDHDREIKKQIKNISLTQADNITYGKCDQITLISEVAGTGKSIKKNRYIGKELFKRILAAKTKIVIDTPYFVANKKAKKILKKAILDNGVTVKLLTNGLKSTDQYFMIKVTNGRLYNWLDRGLELYLYKGIIPDDLATVHTATQKTIYGTHSKTYLFDDSDFMIGTYNFDPRSQNYNAELAVFCDGNRRITQAIDKNIEKRMQASHRVLQKNQLKKIRFKSSKLSKIIKFYVYSIPAYLFPHLL